MLVHNDYVWPPINMLVKDESTGNLRLAQVWSEAYKRDFLLIGP